MRATSMKARMGMRRIKPFFAFPLKREGGGLPMKKKIAGCIQLSIKIIVLPEIDEQCPCYLMEDKTAHMPDMVQKA